MSRAIKWVERACSRVLELFLKKLDKSEGNLLNYRKSCNKRIQVGIIFRIEQGNWWWWQNIEREVCPVPS